MSADERQAVDRLYEGVNRCIEFMVTGAVQGYVLIPEGGFAHPDGISQERYAAAEKQKVIGKFNGLSREQTRFLIGDIPDADFGQLKRLGVFEGEDGAERLNFPRLAVLHMKQLADAHGRSNVHIAPDEAREVAMALAHHKAVPALAAALERMETQGERAGMLPLGDASEDGVKAFLGQIGYFGLGRKKLHAAGILLTEEGPDSCTRTLWLNAGKLSQDMGRPPERNALAM